MVIARRNLMAGKPLPYLRRVAWLQSDSDSHIKTGIFGGRDDCEFEIEYSYSYHHDYGTIFGNYVNASSNCTRISLSASSVGNSFVSNNSRFDSRGYIGTTLLNPRNVFHHVKCSFTDCYVDGTHFTMPQGQGTSNTTEIVLFHSSDYNIGLKISMFRWWQNGVLIRDFVPVLDLNERPAMYDEVSGQLFYNQGTREFTPGPEVI